MNWKPPDATWHVIGSFPFIRGHRGCSCISSVFHSQKSHWQYLAVRQGLKYHWALLPTSCVPGQPQALNPPWSGGPYVPSGGVSCVHAHYSFLPFRPYLCCPSTPSTYSTEDRRSTWKWSQLQTREGFGVFGWWPLNWQPQAISHLYIHSSYVLEWHLP